MDLFTKEVWTFCGLRTAYVLFVLHLGTRRIVLAEATFSPHGQRMGQMARNLPMSSEDLEIAPRFVVYDRDKLLARHFDAVLTTAHAKVVKTPFRAPDANAHAERWVGSVTGECLGQLVLLGWAACSGRYGSTATSSTAIVPIRGSAIGYRNARLPENRTSPAACGTANSRWSMSSSWAACSTRTTAGPRS